MAVVKYWNGSAWVELLPGSQGVQGPQGDSGVQGTQGIQGAQGGSLGTTDELAEGVQNLYFTPSRVAYQHTQSLPSSSWNITHNLGFYPNIVIQDSGGSIVEGEITYTNSNSLTVTFSSAFSGTAYLS